jgi:hypothetical protein
MNRSGLKAFPKQYNGVLADNHDKKKSVKVFSYSLRFLIPFYRVLTIAHDI